MKLHDGQSLIQKTYQRVLGLSDLKEIVTVTNRDYYFQALDEFTEMPESEAISLSFILEPCGRNTAPAIAMAAYYAAEKFGSDVQLLILPADQLIDKQETFIKAVKVAQELAASGHLVTFGLQPSHPDTGFGYIESGNVIDVTVETDGLSACKVKTFAEKPSLPLAKQCVASGKFLWNAGLFCFSAGTFLDSLQQTAPEVYQGAMDCWQQITRAGGMVQIPEETFLQIPAISVDCAVMEKATNVAVVGCDLGWSDVGSWTALSDLTDADANGNRISGEGMVFDSRNCYIRSEDRLVATLGVDDLVVVDTSDALLIANKNRVQDVKNIVQELKVAGHSAYRTHSTVHRPWGTYTELEQGDRFKIKRIVVKPGASLSLQLHHHRCEHWIVVSGTAKVVNGDQDLILNINESTYIPSGAKHRLENPGKIPLTLIEVQSGEYLEEDDIVRFEDIYGRN
jgi:mannose-1-phosphate guanylyltransferase/mannose-6-phosphate isomerase